jgi:hypothetical protein
MTTLAANSVRAFVVGARNHLPVIASDILYEGAAVGDNGAGYARPLSGGDKFRGFNVEKVDNSSGSAGDLNAEVITQGRVKLSVSGAVITDVGQPVYATDDDTFVFSPVGGSYIGRVARWVSSGVVEVDFDALGGVDPYGDSPREAITGAKTLDAQDTGKVFFVTATAVVTLPATAVALEGVKLVCMGPYGTVQISVDPVSDDKVQGPDAAGTNDKDHINTLATAQRGDFVVLSNGHADGAVISEQVGTWATEA